MRRFKLTLRDDGVAELMEDGRQVWASDTDIGLADALGRRALCLEEDDIGDVLEYLVEEGYLTDYQADHCAVVPPDETSDPYEDEDDEDEDDEDEDDEDEYHNEDDEELTE